MCPDLWITSLLSESIMNLLTEASLLAMAKSIYFTLWVGENRKKERGRLQLNLASLSIHGSVKYPVKSHQTLTMTVQSGPGKAVVPRANAHTL